MDLDTGRQYVRRQMGLWVAVLAASLLFWGISNLEAQTPRFQDAVLTSGLSFSPALDGFRAELAQLGYREGDNLAIIIEDAQGDVTTLARRAASLVEAKPDVIFTISTEPTAAAKQATTTLPIVFTFVADPLRSGFIASYASSQNNMTGIANLAAPLSGKRPQILQEIAPEIKRVLALVASQESVATVSFQFLAEAAAKLGIEILRYDVTSRAEIQEILNALPKGAMDAAYHVPSSLLGSHIDLLIRKAREDRIILAVHDDSMLEQGALISYGADIRLLGVQAAQLVAKILKGGKPAEMPIQTPERLALVINLTAAKAIGLDIPRHILERVDRFME